MSDCGDDYLLVYRRFFDNFASSVDLTDQLPVKVASYNLTKFEIAGAVTDWCLQYLNQRHCPPNLIAPLICLVVQEINQMSQKQPEACGYRPSEDDFHSLRLMQVTMRKLVDVCSQYKDNAQLFTLPSPTYGLFSPLISTCAIKNSRRSMEDRHVTIQDFHSLYNIQDYGNASYYGVFDGHNGLDAAVYSVAHLHQYLADSSYYPTDPVNALKEAFKKTDEHFILKSEKENLQSGTTAVCALLRPKESMLYVAWLGDSQAVLVRRGRPIQLVKPHKPERMDEKDRIEQMGGTVLFWGMWRVNGQLAVSRAIGDVKYKPYVSADPDVESIHLDGSEDMLILACDGLWDYVTEKEATNAIYNHLAECPGDVEGVSQRLVALSKGQGSTDNISVVVVFLAEPSEVAQRRHMETASPNPFLKQNGADLYCGVPTNGKLRSCTTAAYDDEDDFGPETDVDMVDDVLLSPSIAAAKALVSGKKDFDDDLERQRQQLSDFDDPADIDRSRDTPTPPAHEVAGNADVDNLTESGDGEDSEEDEWNFIPGSGEDKKQEKTEQEEEDDDMSSQLNPNAAEFVPISPKRSPIGDSDPDVSSSSLCFEKSFDNVSVPTQLEFSSEISKRPGQLDLINGQKEDHPIGNELNDSSINVGHETLEDTNIHSTKAEFGDSSCYETSIDVSNPFSSEGLHCDDQNTSNLNPFSDLVDRSSFDVESLISSTTNELKDTFDAACNLEPIRTIKEFKTFAECLAEPKLSVTTPEIDDNAVPGTPKSTIVEAPISPNSDVSPIPHQEDVESPYEYLSNVPKTPELIRPSEEPHDIYIGQEPTSSSGFESESGADEIESNILIETNLNENDGFIVETKRLSPPIQTLSFKPIEAFGDKNPFGLLENPSPIYKPQVSDEIENVQNLDTNNEIFSDNLSSHMESQDLLMPSFLRPAPSDSENKDDIVTENNETDIEATLDNIINIHSESVPVATEEFVGKVNEDLGLKQDEFAFGGLESEIKPNEFIFGAGSSELETQQNVPVFESKLHETPLLNENEESKIRLDEQQSEQEIEMKDAAFGVDSKQEAIDAITSDFETNLLDESITSGQDFSDEPPLFNPFKEENKAVEYEAKESDFQFDPTDIKSDFILDSFNSGLNNTVFGVGEKKLELDVPKEHSKEVSNIHENEKESDTAMENVASEAIVSPVTSCLLESPVTLETKEDLSTTKSSKDELKLELSDHPEGHSSKPHSSQKDLSPLSPTAQPFVPRIPVVEPLFKKVIVEKKFTEPESDETKEETIFNDFENHLLVETNVSPSEHLSSQIPKLDLDTQICLSEPEIHDVREGINEIIKEAELISNLSTAPDHIIDETVLVPNLLSTEVERVSEILVPQPVSEVLENKLIVQSTEPIPNSLFSTVTEKEPLSPDHLKIVQENETTIEKEQSTVNQHIAFDVKTLEDINEGSSVTGTPPPTPAPGHIEEHGELKEGLLAAAAAVAAAGAVSAVVVSTDKADVKKSTTNQVKKGTQVTAKKLGDASPKTTAKTTSTVSKSAAKSIAAKPSPSEAKKQVPTATTKPLLKTTTASKPINVTAKPSTKPSTIVSKPTATKPATGTSKLSTSPVKTTTGGSKPATPLSKTNTPISKPSTPTNGLRPTSANKPDSGKASPKKLVTTSKTVCGPKPPPKVPPVKVSEKKPLTNGDVSKSSGTKKPDLTATKKLTSTTTTKPPPITRPLSATTKPLQPPPKPPTSTISKPAAPKSLPSALKPKITPPTNKPASKPATSSTVPKNRPASATSTTKSIDKTGKDNANKQISSEKIGSKTLASKTTTKKTDIKTAGSGKPKPVTKPGGDIKKAESITEKIGPTQEGLITTTNGYGDILENGIKKDDSPLDNSQQDMIEAIN